MAAIVLIAIIYFPIFVFFTTPVWIIIGFMGVTLPWMVAIAVIIYVILFLMLVMG
jgi:hypothetical protein